MLLGNAVSNGIARNKKDVSFRRTQLVAQLLRLLHGVGGEDDPARSALLRAVHRTPELLTARRVESCRVMQKKENDSAVVSSG